MRETPCPSCGAILRSSTPFTALDDPRGWQNESPSPRVGLWWAAYLFCGCFGFYPVFAIRGAVAQGDLEAIKSIVPLLIASEILSIVTIALAVSVVLGVVGRQRRRFRQLKRPPADEWTA